MQTDNLGENELLFLKGLAENNLRLCCVAIEQGVQLNSFLSGGETLFHKSMQSPMARNLIGPILSHGGDANLEDASGRVPVEIYWQTNTQKYLRSADLALVKATDVSYLNRPFKDGSTIFRVPNGVCCRMDFVQEFLPLLVEKQIDFSLVDGRGHSALYYWIQPQLALWNTVDKPGKTEKDTICLMYDKGARLTQDEQKEIIDLCMCYGNQYFNARNEMLNYLLEKKIIEPLDPNAQGETMLHRCAFWFDCEKPSELCQGAARDLVAKLSQSYGIDARDNAGQTPLIKLIAAGKKRILKGYSFVDGYYMNSSRMFAVSLLLEAGANPALKDASGRNAMDYAIKTEQPEVQALLKQWYPQLEPNIDQLPRKGMLAIVPLVRAADRVLPNMSDQGRSARG